MNTLPDDVIVHHLLPAIVWVHHWDTCLYDFRNSSHLSPEQLDHLSRRVRTHDRCETNALDYLMRGIGCTCSTDEPIPYVTVQPDVLLRKLLSTDDSRQLQCNIVRSQEYHEHGVCEQCRFKNLLSLRLVNRRLRDAIRMSVLVRVMVRLEPVVRRAPFLPYRALRAAMQQNYLETKRMSAEQVWQTHWTQYTCAKKTKTPE